MPLQRPNSSALRARCRYARRSHGRRRSRTGGSAETIARTTACSSRSPAASTPPCSRSSRARCWATSMLAVLAESETYPASEIVAAPTPRRPSSACPCSRSTPTRSTTSASPRTPPTAATTASRSCSACSRRSPPSADLAVVADGTNADDLADHRPGRRAAAEARRREPASPRPGLTKDDVRAVARLLGLPNAEKPSMACLASRFPYGERIETEGSSASALPKTRLRALGLAAVPRACPWARSRASRSRPTNSSTRGACATRSVAAVKAAGFAYVALDLEGYRTGAMNEVLDASEQRTLVAPARPSRRARAAPPGRRSAAARRAPRAARAAPRRACVAYGFAASTMSMSG